jgi:hypothetical protein
MTRAAGRQDLRALLWRVIRYEAASDSQKQSALRQLAAIERADLGDPDAERELGEILEALLVDDDGDPMWVEPEPSREAAP